MNFRIHQGFVGLCSRILLGIALAMVGELSIGQTLADLDWVVVGPTRQVARITFNANVRFLRQAPLGEADLVQVSFDIVGNDDSILGQTIEEGKRLDRGSDHPGISLTYVPAPAVRTKNLILRLTNKVRLLARQGPDGRTIDLVFGNNETGTALPVMPVAPEDRRFALVLKSVPEGSNESMPRIPGEFQDYAVFTRSIEEDGAKHNALALGYFRSQNDAEIVRKRAESLFPLARVIDLALERTAKPSTEVKVQFLTSAAKVGQFGVLLKTFSADELGAMPRIPVDFQDYAVITRSIEEGGVKRIALAIGYFQSEKEAESVRQRATARFPSAKVFNLNPQEIDTVPVTVALTMTPSLPTPSLGSPKPPSTSVERGTAVDESNIAQREGPASPSTHSDLAASSEVNSKASVLLAKARQAFAEQRFQDAVDPLNQALMLPPNPSSKEAQELIGFVWEGLKQPSKALIEYKLYLKL
ncbi:MAG: hypothetical protein WCH60_15150, partial [Burkholderiales bacterium]